MKRLLIIGAGGYGKVGSILLFIYPFAEKLGGYATKTGKFLGKASLDEISQLWNILKWDMNVIGGECYNIENGGH